MVRKSSLSLKAHKKKEKEIVPRHAQANAEAGPAAEAGAKALEDAVHLPQVNLALVGEVQERTEIEVVPNTAITTGGEMIVTTNLNTRAGGTITGVRLRLPKEDDLRIAAGVWIDVEEEDRTVHVLARGPITGQGRSPTTGDAVPGQGLVLMIAGAGLLPGHDLVIIKKSSIHVLLKNGNF